VADSDLTTGRLLLVEYERLKDEQKTRVTFRDNLIYATLASMAAVIAAALAADGHANLLLLLPPVAVLLGWTYLVNDEKISAIGRYIREELASRLAAQTQGRDPVFRWEQAHRSDARRATRKLLQLAVDLAMFCVSPLAAIVVFWISGPRTAAFLVISIIECLAVLGLAAQITIYARAGRA
jgi:hypothetical protein